MSESSEQRTIDLGTEDAAFIDSSVASGAFASASEVVSAGLAALRDTDSSIERWLREEVAPTYDAVRANPGDVLTGDEVLDRLRARHARSSEGGM